jgi:hypothetical protein
MDGLDAIQIVNFHIINTHTLFPVAFKKMQSLAIAVEVIVFFIIDDDHYLVCINAKIFVTDIIRMFVIDRLL